MRLRTKALTIIGLIWLAFIALTSLTYIRDTNFIYFSLLFLSLILTMGLTYFLVIKPVERLNKKLNAICLDTSFSQRLDLNGGEEVTSISRNINMIIDLVRRSHEKIDVEKEPSLIGQKQYLAQVAHYDNLTSLPNRVVFNEILNKAISHAKRHKKIMAILIISLGSLRKINDKFGDKKSDHLLREIGKRFASALRSEDVIAKLDGDEFIILLNDITKPKFASAVAEKLLKASAQPLSTGSNEFSIQSNIGICIYPYDGESLETLLKHLDLTLYKAKHNGGGAYQFYSHEMDIEGHEYIQLESALRKAITNHEFTLHYQPKLSIKKGSIVSVEALMRWEHPELGIVNPEKFLTLAEDTGMINLLGAWALREACKMNKYWQDEGYEHISVSLNLSHKQFHHPDIAEIIADIVRETGLNPGYLELEIAEKTVMDDTENAVSILNKIKETGVHIALDHFGTGHTSISHLKQFPISTLKIDQNFIKGIPNTPNDSAITSAIIALAHQLGFEVVASGVETAEQVQFLASQNCDMVQGYFLSHPLPAENVALQLKKLRDEVLP